MPVEAIPEDLLGVTVNEVSARRHIRTAHPSDRGAFVHANDTPARPRVTPAHEVGHWVANGRKAAGARTMCRAEDVNVVPATGRMVESEANVCAAELLMPEGAARAAAGKASGAAKRFYVSAQAMVWQPYGFGLGDKPA
jgi:Zn-dependent peptidase ImmA (M78 family)